MRLYHYRSVKNALIEIKNGTFHFAEREALNDPLEGFVRVYWQGDKAAWEGLFKHYICSLAQAVDLYLFAADEDSLLHHSLEVDIHRWDDVPYGSVLLKLRTEFLADPDIQLLAEFYGNHGCKVFEKELRFIIRLMHSKALVSYIRYLQKVKGMPENEAERIIKGHNVSFHIGEMLSKMKQELSDEKERIRFMEAVETCFTDEQERAYIQAAAQTDLFLHGDSVTDQDSDGKKKTISVAQQRRNWLTVMSDFPKVFIEQLKEMIYPKSYVVCFSGKNDDSSMWGNYADCHRGICLIYDMGDENTLFVKPVDTNERKLSVKPVRYGGNIIERNFFQTIGSLNRSQVKEWLTGTAGVSSCYNEICADVKKWRERYWEVFDTKTFRKTMSWKHEGEYRAAVDNTFYEFDEPQKQNLKFDWKILKGVIFGLCTTEYDKKRIWDALMEHRSELTDFTFYQAEYDEEEQQIKIRKKVMWKLF